MGVYRWTGGPLRPGTSQVWWFWLSVHPGNVPDVSLTWELRPVRQSGHDRHIGHKVRLEPIEVERADLDPAGNFALSSVISWFRIVSTGTHETEWEMLASWQDISGAVGGEGSDALGTLRAGINLVVVHDALGGIVTMARPDAARNDGPRGAVGAWPEPGHRVLALTDVSDEFAELPPTEVATKYRVDPEAGQLTALSKSAS